MLNLSSIPGSLFRLIGALTITLCAIGCGGSGSGGSQFTNKPVSDTARVADITAVNTKFSSLAALPLATQAQQIVAAMATMSDFEAEGIADDGSAWGRFTDGRILICETNRPVGNITPAVQTVHPAETQLPTSTTCDLFNAFGAGYMPGAPAVLQDLNAYGYTAGSTVQSPAVDTLRAVNTDGVFYVDTHGGMGHSRDGKTVYGIFTGTKQSTALDTTYKDDLDSLRLVYMSAPTEDAGGHSSGYETHYVITGAFVTKYMKFGPDSLVFMNACTSNNAEFSAACTAAGAGYYLGWTKPVGDQSAYDAAAFLFDRLLGIDAVAPVDKPAKPPYTLAEVITKMGSTTDPNTNLFYSQSAVDFSGRAASSLVFTQGPGDLTALAPVITSIAPDAKTNTAVITGTFGSDTGTVDTGGTTAAAGTDLAVQSWSPTSITVTLTSLATNAIVRVNGRPSNSMKINPYGGNYTGTYVGTASDGTFPSGPFAITIQASGSITGTASGSIAVSGSIDNTTGAVTFGTADNAVVQATYTGNFKITAGIVTGSGTWNSLDTSNQVTSSGSWSTN